MQVAPVPSRDVNKSPATPLLAFHPVSAPSLPTPRPPIHALRIEGRLQFRCPCLYQLGHTLAPNLTAQPADWLLLRPASSQPSMLRPLLTGLPCSLEDSLLLALQESPPQSLDRPGSPWGTLPLPPHPSVDLSPGCGDVSRGLAGSGEVLYVKEAEDLKTTGAPQPLLVPREPWWSQLPWRWPAGPAHQPPAAAACTGRSRVLQSPSGETSS